MADYKTIAFERKGRIAYIMLNRPDALNTMTNELEAELRTALMEFDLDSEAWVAIIHGAGRCFCAGADLKAHSSFAFGISEAEMEAQDFLELPLSATHGRVAGNLAGTHKDPFDRMLAAQALTEGLVLISNDAALDAFGVQRLW